HPVEVGIIGDAKSASEAIYEGLSKESKAKDTARLDMITKRNDEWNQELVDLAMEEGDPINPRRALLELRRALPDNTMISSDIGNVSSVDNEYMTFNERCLHIDVVAFGNCGFAYPAALVAQLAEPESPSVAIVGDGAWRMSFHEVSTAVEQNIPVIACVFNN